ncbi:MAG: acyl-CoA thioesterase [Candidatus Tectomicrobia bacterium]|nr:acyl-CoA thioesterase [Candidatus Tectomicrobia bacterium]
MSPHVSEIVVRYAETDQMGVAHHSAYLIWFEVARTDLFRKLGCAYRDLEARGFRMPVVESGCRHRAGARYDDRVWVEARIGKVRRTRVRVEYTARNEEGKVLAEGFTVHPFLNREMRPQRFPEEMAAALRANCVGPSATKD